MNPNPKGDRKHGFQAIPLRFAHKAGAPSFYTHVYSTLLTSLLVLATRVRPYSNYTANLSWELLSTCDHCLMPVDFCKVPCEVGSETSSLHLQWHLRVHAKYVPMLFLLIFYPLLPKSAPALRRAEASPHGLDCPALLWERMSWQQSPHCGDVCHGSSPPTTYALETHRFLFGSQCRLLHTTIFTEFVASFSFSVNFLCCSLEKVHSMNLYTPFCLSTR